MLDEECPKCGAMFPADRAWANRSLAFFFSTLQDLEALVRCPRCDKIFESREFRFFGFIRPRTMRIGLGLLAVVVVIGGIYNFFIDFR